MEAEELIKLLRSPGKEAHELRKSLRLAVAVAKDHTEFFKVHAEGLVGTTKPRRSDSPGVFIRTTTFKLSYDFHFLSRKEAEEVKKLTDKAITKWREKPRIKECSTDFGLIESAVNLHERGSKLENSVKIAEKLLLSIKYGL